MMRIACTAIAKRIMSGRVSKSGLNFIGDPKDVTSDCLKAVIDFIGIGETKSVHVEGVQTYEISVKKL